MNNKLTKGIITLAIIGSGIASAFAADMMTMENKMDAPMKMEIRSNLMLGSKGQEVTALQIFLIEKNYLNMSNKENKGYFGMKTKLALKKYQKSEGIRDTGFFGPMTRSKLNMSMMNVKDVSMGVMVGGAAMLPNRDIVDNAVLANNVTTVVAAVKAAGLVDTLKSAGPFTVFAPNNKAFEALPAGTVETLLKTENKATLVDILTYHVVTGAYTSKDLKDGLTLKTVEGKSLTFTKIGGKLMINGSASVETADVISSNGVTHVIDSVLMPK